MDEQEVVEAEVKPGRKIAMIGTAPSTRGLAPKDTDWEVWSQADFWTDLVRIDRWFEFAPMPKLKEHFPEYLDFLRTAKFPVYMRAEYEEIPTSEPFPFDGMVEKFGKEFMTATLVWMMCMAAVEHMEGNTVETIGLWGYDMALDGEYAHQRPGIRHMEWVLGTHLPALGFEPITVMVPKGSDLTITPIPYPFAEDDPTVAKIRSRRRDIQTRLNHVLTQANDLEAQATTARMNQKYLEGAMEDLNYFDRMFCGVKHPAA